MSRTAVLIIGALLLILVGTVLQLDVLGYAHLNSDNIWFMSVIAEGLWNAAATPMEMPSLREIVSFWPLLIVFSGFAILVSRRLSDSLREPAAENSRSEGRQDA